MRTIAQPFGHMYGQMPIRGQKMEPESLGIYWREEEVQLLLQSLHRQEAGRRVMASTHMENMGIFAQVAKDLREAGYPRSPVQCRARFKRAKTDFFEALEDWESLPPRVNGHPIFVCSGTFGNRAASRRGRSEGSQLCSPLSASLRPRRRRRRRPVATEAGAVSGTEEEGAVPGPSGEPQVPVQRQPEACIVLQTTPEASAADVTALEHEGPSSPVVMKPMDTPLGDATGGEGPVPAADVSGPAVAEAPTMQSLAAQLAGHVAQADHHFDLILYLLDLQQKAFRRLN
ncbi:UNVERIFIED_CONTAM: hypothetical protein K2H54_041841 [Gekko kuhli]